MNQHGSGRLCRKYFDQDFNNYDHLKDEEFFILKQNSDNLNIDNFVNSKTMKIEKVNVKDRPSESSLEIKYEDFTYRESV